MSRKKAIPSRSNRLPSGYTEDRVRAILSHYEKQSPAEATEEDEQTLASTRQTLMVLPMDLVGEVAILIAKHQSRVAKRSRKSA